MEEIKTSYNQNNLEKKKNKTGKLLFDISRYIRAIAIKKNSTELKENQTYKPLEEFLKSVFHDIWCCFKDRNHKSETLELSASFDFTSTYLSSLLRYWNKFCWIGPNWKTTFIVHSSFQNTWLFMESVLGCLHLCGLHFLSIKQCLWSMGQVYCWEACWGLWSYSNQGLRWYLWIMLTPRAMQMTTEWSVN